MDVSIEIQFELLRSITQIVSKFRLSMLGVKETECADNEPSLLCHVI